MLPREATEYDRAVERLRAEVGTGELPPAWEVGRRLSADEAVAFAPSGSSQPPA